MSKTEVHCSPERIADEFAVPLAVVASEGPLRALLARAPERMRDRVSHRNIFPTLLYAFGYPRDWIEAHYGSTLAGPPMRYVSLISLPYPSRQRPNVEFAPSDEFPGRGAVRAAGGD